ncbi:MAG: TIGR01777 family oxidoreductase [Lentimicrobium sp.]|nr:TIGR01777 family oxidoreductase [Lentimicrobium sp.]
MNILIAGSTGLVGRKLTEALKQAGHKVSGLGRADFSGTEAALEQKVGMSEVVINLSGAPIVARWSESYKKEIIDSRILTTRKLVEALKASHTKPRLFISTSAVGIYPEGQVFTEENSEYGNDFLADVCKLWEKEALKAPAGIDVAIFRLGVVLAREGGALLKMLLPFRLGLGGPVAGGKQGFSWIHIDDLIQAYLFVIEKNFTGVFNLTAPEITDNAGFTKELAKAVKRPAVFPVPAFALKLVYGEGASALTSGQKVLPARLQNEGFGFRFPKLKEALEDIVRKK